MVMRMRRTKGLGSRARVEKVRLLDLSIIEICNVHVEDRSQCDFEGISMSRDIDYRFNHAPVTIDGSRCVGGSLKTRASVS